MVTKPRANVIGEMSPEERRAEIGELLACGLLLRATASHKSLPRRWRHRWCRRRHKRSREHFDSSSG